MKKKILLIDDSQTQLTSLKLTLLKSGYDIVTAQNGVEGISTAYQILPDLIISDIVMPDINGYHLCRLLKNDNSTKNIPIILLTCLNEKIDKFWGLRAGADAFLTKDSKSDFLISKIDGLLSNSVDVTEEERIKAAKKRKFGSSDIQSRINQLLDQSLIEFTIINEFRNLSELILNIKVLDKEVFSLISAIVEYNVAGIFFNDRDEKKERIVNFSTSGFEPDKEMLEVMRSNFFSSVIPEEYSLDENVFNYEIMEKSTENNLNINQVSDFQSKLIIPMVHANKVLGGICLYHIEPDKYNSSRIFNIILDELKLLMRIRWLYSETKFLTITDGLTGLYNRRYFQQSLEKEFARAKRYDKALSIAMIDIDHFKKINDTYGHQFGDKILAEISLIVKNSLRKTDYIARYGGEEIVAILPETNIEKTATPIERLRKNIENKDFKFGNKSVKVTVSIGVASLTDSVEIEQDLVEKADQALYAAKENGRNRVEFYWEI